ncbi:MAG: hypothetical protein ACOYEV_12585 [Candidatus Nanopelagicales bacterium]
MTAKGADAVMLYQSFSGDAADQDAATSTSTLVLRNTKITYTGTGPVLYFTNTSAKVTVTNSSFVAKKTAVLASAAEDRWGTSGSNGATAAITVTRSRLTGKVTAGNSSSITMKLKKSSKLSGKTSGQVKVTIDSTSKRTS